MRRMFRVGACRAPGTLDLPVHLSRLPVVLCKLTDYCTLSHSVCYTMMNLLTHYPLNILRWISLLFYILCLRDL